MIISKKSFLESILSGTYDETVFVSNIYRNKQTAIKIVIVLNKVFSLNFSVLFKILLS